MAEIKLKAKIEAPEVDEVIQKLQQLSELLKEANSLIHELASTELNLNVNLMAENKKSADCSALGNELDKLLGPDEFKALGQDLAMVIANHALTKKPDICEKVFSYMSFVIRGWNS